MASRPTVSEVDALPHHSVSWSGSSPTAAVDQLRGLKGLSSSSLFKVGCCGCRGLGNALSPVSPEDAVLLHETATDRAVETQGSWTRFG